MPTERTLFGDVSHTTAGKYMRQLLDRSVPSIVTEITAQAKPLEKNSGNIAIFSRYESLAIPTAPLQESVTPKASKPTKTEIKAILQQYGDWIEHSDRVSDFAEDPVLQEYKDILAEQMRELREVLNFGILISGSTVYYAGNVADRTYVNSFTTAGQLQQVTRYLMAQKAQPFTEIINATAKYGTHPISPGYVAYGHTDLKADIRKLQGFVPVYEYSDSSMRIHAMEVGAVDDVRFVLSPIMPKWADAGASTSTMLSTSNSVADVYPLVIVAKDAWATVPLRGPNIGTPMVVNPEPAHGNPMGLVGSIAWKYYHAGCILNDTRIARIEVAATRYPT